MNNSIVLLFLFFASSCLVAQSELNIFFGTDYLLRSQGIAHSIGLQKLISDKERFEINAEINGSVGGPFGAILTPSLVKGIEPYLQSVMQLVVAGNVVLKLPACINSKFSFGVSTGYSGYVFGIQTITQTSDGLGGTVSTFFEKRHRLVLGATARYLFDFHVDKLTFVLIPNYSYYRSSVDTHALGVMLMLRL